MVLRCMFVNYKTLFFKFNIFPRNSLMSSEEEDYMSDAFLPKESNEIRPGLIKNKITQRTNAIAAKKARYDDANREKTKPRKVSEQERRDEGLSIAISSQNKGFAMLAKMGYKEGQAIGKSSQGILEPIKIDIKTDRGGLGREAALKQLKKHQQAIRINRLKRSEDNAISTDEFRKRMTQRAQGNNIYRENNNELLLIDNPNFTDKQMEANLGKCQRACEKLDMEQNIEKAALHWFWPNRNFAEDDEEQDESDDDSDSEEVEYDLIEKLEMLTNYLRTTYCFCHWCGTKYLDIDDMNDSCPGMTKDEH